MTTAGPGRDRRHQDVPAIRLVRPPRVLRGTGIDQRQPVILADVVVNAPRASGARFHDLLRQILGDGQATPLAAESSGAKPGANVGLGDVVLHWAVMLQREAGQPVFDSGLVIGAAADRREALTLVMPYSDPVVGRRALGWAVATVGQLAAAGYRAPPLGKIRKATSQLLAQLRTMAPRTFNAVNFLRAAHELRLPWARLTANVYQVGQGSRGRWLNSSINDRTSAIGVQLARNKADTAVVLRRAGIPVPDVAVTTTVQSAVAMAGRLGYPVVVKPLDRDGGVGVAAGLDDETALCQAYDVAAKLGRQVLVEKHIEGRDFRLFVVDGGVRLVIERLPGGVTGDGVRSVSTLLAELNADPRRGASSSHALRTIDLDDEAADLLHRQKLTPGSVPAAGQFVRLRRISNVARGGMPVVIPLEQVHADNLRLAVRAAQSLRLDVAGVDFITPDISRPWYETACGINEVNAQPSLGLLTAGHLFPEILHWLLAGTDGRIPTIAVVGNDGKETAAVASLIHGRLSEFGHCCGLATHEGAWIGAERVAWTDMSGCSGGQLLLGDARCDSAVVTLPQESLRAQGLPFDCCDVVVRLATGRVSCPFEAALLRGARQAVVLGVDDGVLGDGAQGTGKPPIVFCGGAKDPRIVDHVGNSGTAVCVDGHDVVVRSSYPYLRLPLAGKPDRRYLFALAALVALREPRQPRRS